MPSAADALNQVLAGNKTAGTGKKKPVTRKPSRELLRLANRVGHLDPTDEGTAGARQVVIKALSGYTPADIRRVGKKAEIPGSQIAQLVRAAKAAQNTNQGTFNPGTEALDIMGRPQQAILGGVTEGLSGAGRGLTGQEQYTPIQSALRVVAGQSQKEAAQTEAGLNPWVRTGTNIAGTVATDPWTWVTLGTSAAGASAAREAGIGLAESRGLIDAATAATLRETGQATTSAPVRNIIQNIATTGLKRAATRVERRALPRTIARRANTMQGGVRVFGRTVPGTPNVQRALAGLRGPHGINELAYPGAQEDLANVAAPVRSVRQAQIREIQKAAFHEKGLSADEQSSVIRAIDVGGGEADIAALPEKLQGPARAYRKMLNETEQKDIASGTLQTPEEALKTGRRIELQKGLRKAEPLRRRAEAIQVKAAKARVEADQALADVKRAQEMKTVGEFGKPLSNARRAEGDIGGHITGKDINAERAVSRLRETYGKAEARAQQLENQAGIASRRLQKHLADTRRKVSEVWTPPEGGYFPHRVGAKETAPGGGGATTNPFGRLGYYTKGRQKALAQTPLEDQVIAGADTLVQNARGTVKAATGGKVYPVERVLNPETTTPARQLPVGRIVGERAALSVRDRTAVDYIHGVQNVSDASKAADGVELMIPNTRWTKEMKTQVASRKFQVDSTVELNGEKYVVKDAPVDAWKVPGEKPHVASGKVLIHKDIADDWSKVATFLGDNTQVNKWLQAYDHGLGLWKAYATVLGPLGGGFMLRNFVGNIFNGFWLPSVNPRYMFSARKLQWLMHQGRAESGDALSLLDTAKPLVKGMTNRQLVEEAWQSRALEGGFESVEMVPPDTLKGVISKAMFESRGSPASQRFIPLEWGRRMNTAIENNARLGMYIGLRHQGYSSGAAGALVRKYLFDYADIGSVTQAVKRVVPFYTWTRKNIPLQIEALLKTPGKLMIQQHILEGLRNVGAPYDPLSMPDWIKKQQGVVLPVKGEGGTPLALLPDTPLTSAEQTLAPLGTLAGMIAHPKRFSEPGKLGELLSQATQSIGPGGPIFGPLGAGLEIAAGGQAFSRRQFEQGGLINTPSYLGGSHSPLGKMIAPELQYLIESGLPGLAKFRGVFPTTASERRPILNIGGVPITRRLLSLLGGQAIYPLTNQTKKSELFRRGAELRAYLAYLKTQGVKVPSATDLKKKSAGTTTADLRKILNSRK